MRRLVLLAALATAIGAAPRRPHAAEATAALRRAREAFRDGDYARASRLLDGLEVRLPRNADYVLYLAAESAFYVGQTARARPLFERLAARQGSRFAPVASWRAADCLWTNGDRTAAAAAYRRLLSPAPPGRARGKGRPASAAPSGRDPYVDLAVPRFRVAEAASGGEAARLYRAIFAEFPAHPLAEEARRRAEALAPTPKPETSAAPVLPEERLRRARAFAEARSHAAAAAELAALPAALPEPLRTERDFELAVAKYRSRRDYAGAAALFAAVAPRLSGERAAYASFHAARALSRAHRDDEAIAGYRQVVERHGSSRWAAEAQFLSGWLELNRGRFRQAVPALRETLARFSRSPLAEDAAWFLGLAHLLAGDPGPALEAFSRHERLASSGRGGAEAARRGLYFRGRSLLALGRTDEALALFRDGVRRWPLTYYGLLSRARLKAAGIAEAVELPTRPVSLAPVKPAAARDPAVARADELAAAGLDVEAGVELVRDEDALTRRLGAEQALVVLFDRLPRFESWRRPYQLAEARGAAALGGAPTGPARAYWEAAYPRAYRPLVERFGPPAGAPPLLLYTIMRKESGFSPHVVSYADARGLMQLLPPTSAAVARSIGRPFHPDELFDPETNLALAAGYIGALHGKFGRQVVLTAAAYNGGSGAVMRWCDQHGRRPLDEFIELVSYDQSREYAKRVAGIYAHYVYLYEGKAYDLPLTIDCRYEKGTLWDDRDI